MSLKNVSKNMSSATRIIIILFSISIIGCNIKKNESQQKPESISKTLSGFNLSKINELDSIVKLHIAQNKSVGIEFGIQIGDNTPVIKRYGYSDLERKKILTETDLFRIASITKIFTATAIMKLVEESKISLNDKLNKFFPDFPNGKNITIYQMLSHTSGIPNWWNGELPDQVPKDFPMCEKPHLYIQAMKKPSIFAPGEFYSYSNSNYVLLGEIIEQVSGQSYEKFLKENIFEPAGMTETEMEYIERPSKQWVKGYAYDENEKNPFVAPEIYHMPFSAGGLRSNSIELLKFMKTLNSGKIVKKETLDKMTQYATLSNGKPVYEGPYVPPNSEPSKPRAHRTRFGYGLGFHLVELYGKKVFYHSGGIAGFNSYLIHFPDNNTTISILSNTEDGIVSLLEELRRIGNDIEPQY